MHEVGRGGEDVEEWKCGVEAVVQMSVIGRDGRVVWGAKCWGCRDGRVGEGGVAK